MNSSSVTSLIMTCSHYADNSKNGAVVGAVYKDIKGLLLPTVAVHSQNEEYVAPLFN